MDTSVLIVTYNRVRLLARTLLGLAPQLGSSDQVVIVDDGSDDGTEEFVRSSYPEMTFYRVPQNQGYRLSTRINEGLLLCRHDMIWRLDSDCVPSAGCLDTLKGLFAENRIIAGAIRYADQAGNVSDRDHPYRLQLVQALAVQCPEAFWTWRRTGILNYPVLCFGGNLTFSKASALSVGGFDSDFDGNWGAEDAWFGDMMLCRSKASIIYSLHSSVVHQWHSQSGDHRSADRHQRNLELWMRKSEAMHGEETR